MLVQNGIKVLKNSFVIVVLSIGCLPNLVFAGEKSELIPKAIKSGDMKELKRVLKGFDETELEKYINMPADDYGYTPLFRAVINRDIAMVALLLENGAKKSVNIANIIGETPLWCAADRGSIDIVKLLLENGAKESVNIADKLGNTPLSRTVLRAVVAKNIESIETTKLLLENGAKESINKADEYGWTPLERAVENKNLYMVKLLLYFGAKVTEKVLKLINKNDKSTIALLIKKPLYLESQLSKEEKEEFAKLRGGDGNISPTFQSGLEGEEKETKFNIIYKNE